MKREKEKREGASEGGRNGSEEIGFARKGRKLGEERKRQSQARGMGRSLHAARNRLCFVKRLGRRR